MPTTKERAAISRALGLARPLVVLPYPHFVDRVQYAPVDECWLWLGAPDTWGYGVITIDWKTMKVHRFAYLLWSGPIPDGLVIDHLCFVRACVNPQHLEAVTPEENQRRMNNRHRNGFQLCRRCGHDDWLMKKPVNGAMHRQCRECRRRYLAAQKGGAQLAYA